MGAFHKVAMTIGVTALSVAAAFRLARIAAEYPADAFVLGAGLGVLLMVELIALVVMWVPDPSADGVDVRCGRCGEQHKMHEWRYFDEDNGTTTRRCPVCLGETFRKITP